MKRKKRRHFLKAGVLTLGTIGSVASGAALYVDDSAPTSGQTGASWDHPYVTIQQAVSAASPGDEIRVGQGSYYPSSQSTSIELKHQVRIKGGYAGYGAGSPDVRGFLSTLSGDLGGGTHAYHVVKSTGSTLGAPSGEAYEDKANLDGFKITAGVADGTGTNQDIGGGIFIDQGHPTIRDCWITENEAEEAGGGIMCLNTATAPEIRNCKIENNSTDDDGGGLAGNDAVTVINTIFFDNDALASGGGVNMLDSDPDRGLDAKFINCKFIANQSHGDDPEGGGGLYVYDNGAFTMINCLVEGNDAAGGGVGGGVAVAYPTSHVENCTVANNHADNGGGMYVYCLGSTSTLENSILWDNSIDVTGSSARPDILLAVSPGYGLINTTTEQTTDISGTGVLHSDPSFVDPEGDDSTPATLDDNFQLSCGSPCLDTGDYTLVNGDEFDADEDGFDDGDEKTPDLDLADRILGATASGYVDRGAYEKQITSPCSTPQDGDTAPLSCTDGQVNIDDLLVVVNGWGACPPAASFCPGDLVVNSFHQVDMDDLLLVINNWSHDCNNPMYDAGSLSSVEDCMGAATNEELEPYSTEWDDFVDKCVAGLCEAEIIDCD